MTDEEYQVVLDNTAKEIAAQQKWVDDQKAAFDRVLQTRRDLDECRRQLDEARAALKDLLHQNGFTTSLREKHTAALKAAEERT